VTKNQKINLRNLCPDAREHVGGRVFLPVDAFASVVDGRRCRSGGSDSLRPPAYQAQKPKTSPKGASTAYECNTILQYPDTRISEGEIGEHPTEGVSGIVILRLLVRY
jgi:hypothetical protein